MNVYYYMTYDDQIDFDLLQDEKMKVGVECQIINFGQTPIQLLNKQHPPRSA